MRVAKRCPGWEGPLSTVEFSVGDSPQVVQVELAAADVDDGLARAGYGDRALVRASISLDEALATIRPVAESIISQLGDIRVKPAEVSVSFSLRLSATASAKIVTGEAESHIDVSLRWHPGGS